MPFHVFRRLVLLAALTSVAPLAAQAQDVERACERAARDNGYRVVEYGKARSVYSGERLSGYAMQLRIRRDRDRDEASATCVFRLATGGAALTKIEGGRREEADRRPPSERETQSACVRAVERRDFRIQRVVGSRTQTDDRRNAIGRAHVFLATRDRREWRVECNYDFRSGRTQVDYFRP